MRALPALVTVAVMIAPLAGAGCYSVPDLSDGGTTPPDGSSRGDGGGSGSGSSSGSSSGSGGSSGSSSSSGGPSDASTHPDASCMGLLCTCNNANDCATHVCAQPSNVGSTIFTHVPSNLSAGFCTEGCCTSADCPSGTVCWGSGTGGQYCVDPTWLGRSKPASPPTLKGGSSCSTGSQCNSGLCVNGSCADTCCSYADSTTECASPNASCVFGAFPGMQGLDNHFAPRCAPLPGNTQTGNPCGQNSDCQGGLCYYFGGAIGSDCTQPCRTTPECGSDSVCTWDVNGSDVYAACFPLNMLSGFGASCSNDNQCASGICNSTNCTGPCFADGDCSGVSGWRCTPDIVLSFMTVGNYSVLSCGP